jgi:hypothetical protein
MQYSNGILVKNAAISWVAFDAGRLRLTHYNKNGAFYNINYFSTEIYYETRNVTLVSIPIFSKNIKISAGLNDQLKFRAKSLMRKYIFWSRLIFRKIKNSENKN